MKKLVTVLMIGILSIACVFMATACGDNTTIEEDIEESIAENIARQALVNTDMATNIKLTLTGNVTTKDDDDTENGTYSYEYIKIGSGSDTTIKFTNQGSGSDNSEYSVIYRIGLVYANVKYVLIDYSEKEGGTTAIDKTGLPAEPATAYSSLLDEFTVENYVFDEVDLDSKELKEIFDHKYVIVTGKKITKGSDVSYSVKVNIPKQYLSSVSGYESVSFEFTIANDLIVSIEGKTKYMSFSGSDSVRTTTKTYKVECQYDYTTSVDRPNFSEYYIDYDE